MGEIKGALDGIKVFTDSVGNIIHYISHPLDLLLEIWKDISAESFFICMVACLIGVILYIADVEKGKKIAIGSIFIYIVICMINSEV